MNLNHPPLVDRRPEHKQRRVELYLLAFVALYFALQLQTVSYVYFELANRGLFLWCVAAAAISAAVVVHLRNQIAVERVQAEVALIGVPKAAHSGLWLAARARHPDWAIHLTWPGAIRESKLLKLLRGELRPARADERPVGLMVIEVEPVEDMDLDGRDYLMGIVAQDLGFYIEDGTLTFRLRQSRLAVLTARLDVLDELRELAEALEAEAGYRSEVSSNPFRLAVGIAVSMQARLQSRHLLEKAKAALAEAKALGLTSQILIAD
jgi:GGDEF domain-containing protein